MSFTPACDNDLPPGAPVSSPTTRIPCIDIAKGLGMVLVVWVHTWCPFWLTHLYVNSYFFLLSGLFFRPRPWKQFAATQWHKLLRPFLIYYVIAIPFQILYRYIDHRTLADFDWASLLSLFTYASGTGYLFNIPLWFLLALTWVRFAYRAVWRLPRRILFAAALACITAAPWIAYNIKSYLMLNQSVGPFGYYTLGVLGGPWLLGMMRDTRKARRTAAVSGALMLTLWASKTIVCSRIALYPLNAIQTVAAIVFTLSLCALFCARAQRLNRAAAPSSIRPDTDLSQKTDAGTKNLQKTGAWVRLQQKLSAWVERQLLWIGANTVPILGLHLLILLPLNNAIANEPRLSHWYVGALLMLLTLWLIRQALRLGRLVSPQDH